jgi:serine/threonine protein phosphatase 1
MKRQWVIADVHGCAKSLKHLVEEQIKLTSADELYLLGDYIDRGPDSRGVIDYVIQLKAMGYKVFPLKGNHEDVLLRCYAHEQGSPQALGLYELKEGWLYFGGKATLKSFGTKNILDIPKHYIEFMQNLPYYYVLDNFVLTHAGLNFEIDNPFSDELSMLWIKDYTVDKAKIQNRRLIHGHVPYSLNDIKNQIQVGDAISLDNGCVYEQKGRGNLIALELNTLELKVQANLDVAIQKQIKLPLAA